MIEYDIFDKNGEKLNCTWYLSQDGTEVIQVIESYGYNAVGVKVHPASSFTMKLRKYEQND